MPTSLDVMRKSILSVSLSLLPPLLLVLFLCPAFAGAADLYKITMVRAAPGQLLGLIEMYQKRMPVYDASGDERPLWMRHTQGDQWDVMLIFPLGSFSEYYSPERVARRDKAARDAGVPQPDFAKLFYEHAGWHEDVYVEGPPLASLKKAYREAGFFHAEMFVALPGKQDDLLKERDMENAFGKALGRPWNFTFVHDQGAAWDVISLGFYRDFDHFAETRRVSPADADAAAKAAGFEDAAHVGPYLRTLIATHHDTLGTTLK
jgi:hypothetical protein